MFTRILAAIGNSTRSMNKSAMVKASDALKGRAQEMPVSETHAVNKNPLKPPFPDNTEMAMFGMGCFWGAERQFWKIKGVFSTQVGYSAGFTPNPTYNEVCTGKTGHNEVVRVVFDPAAVSYADLVRSFFDNHNPTQGNCQGNDVGTQYRSGIYTYGEDQKATAEAYKKAYQEVLHKAKKADITTEILAAPTFYYAEDYHQQYLHKQPGGYCGLGGIPGDLRCPRGVIVGGSDKH